MKKMLSFLENKKEVMKDIITWAVIVLIFIGMVIIFYFHPFAIVFTYLITGSLVGLIVLLNRPKLLVRCIIWLIKLALKICYGIFQFFDIVCCILVALIALAFLSVFIKESKPKGI